jgi:hypothetical protein
MKNIRVSLEKRDVRLLGGLLADMQANLLSSTPRDFTEEFSIKYHREMFEDEIEKIKARLMTSENKASKAKMNISISKSCLWSVFFIMESGWKEHYDTPNRIMIGEVLSKIMAAYRK